MRAHTHMHAFSIRVHNSMLSLVYSIDNPTLRLLSGGQKKKQLPYSRSGPLLTAACHAPCCPI